MHVPLRTGVEKYNGMSVPMRTGVEKYTSMFVQMRTGVEKYIGIFVPLRIAIGKSIGMCVQLCTRVALYCGMFVPLRVINNALPFINKCKCAHIILVALICKAQHVIMQYNTSRVAFARITSTLALPCKPAPTCWGESKSRWCCHC